MECRRSAGREESIQNDIPWFEAHVIAEAAEFALQIATASGESAGRGDRANLVDSGHRPMPARARRPQSNTLAAGSICAPAATSAWPEGRDGPVMGMSARMPRARSSSACTLRRRQRPVARGGRD